MNRVALRGLVASLAIVAALIMTGCDPGAGGGSGSAAPASAVPAAPASAAPPGSAAPASATPDYGY
jgi:hypothetical protein